MAHVRRELRKLAARQHLQSVCCALPRAHPYLGDATAVSPLVNFIRGVDDFAHFGRIGEERNHLFPLTSPHGSDGGKFPAPVTVLEFGQCRRRGLGRSSLVNRSERCGQRFTLFPARQRERITDEVHDAGLNLCLRVDRFDGFRKAAQAIDHGDQNVGQAPVLQLVKNLEPELGALGVLDPQPQHLLAPVRANAQCQVNGLVPDRAFIANLQPQRIKIDDRIHRLQGSGLPQFDFGQHFVGNGGNQIGGDFQPVELSQVALNLAYGHASRIQADH